MDQLELEFKDLVAEISVITTRKKKPAKSKLAKKEFDLIEFKRVLNQEPPKKLIKVNKEYGNKFIPIQVVEQMLMAMFDAYEVVTPFSPVLMEGQVITTVNLIVHHPVLNRPLTYSGISCVPLIAANNTQMAWNHRNVAGGKGFAILNASKEIGQIFRAEKDDHSDLMRDYFEKKQVELPKEDKAALEMKKRLLQMIEFSKTKASLNMKKKDIDKLNDESVNSAYKEKLNNLKK